MATLLMTVSDSSGHILPILSIAQALVKRGHRILIHTKAHNRAKVQAAGAELVPMSEDCNLASRLANSLVQRPWWLPAFADEFWRYRCEVLAVATCMVAELETTIQQEQVDCVVSDFLGFGASYVAEKFVIPFLTIAPAWVVSLTADARLVCMQVPLPSRLIHALMNLIFPLQRVRNQIGLPQRSKDAQAEYLAAVVSKLLHVVTMHRDFIPAEQLQENQIFIGPTSFEMPRPSDAPSIGASLNPDTVLISTTTSAISDNNLFRQMLEPIAQMGIPILATFGTTQDVPTDLGEHVQLEKFVPHEDVLPYIKAFVTSGGCGMVGRAFRLGVPMLIIPACEESEATAIRAEELGLAYYIPRNRATPELIQAKLNALLEDLELHDRVKALADQLGTINAPELAATAIEGVLTTVCCSLQHRTTLLASPASL